MHAKRGEDEYRSKGNQAKCEEEMATSQGKQNTVLNREQGCVENVDITKMDKRTCRKREEEVWKRRMSTDKKICMTRLL